MQRRRRTILAAIFSGLVLTAGSVTSTSAGEPPIPKTAPLYTGKLSDGPAERAALRNLAQFETGDVSAAVVTHTVTTRVAGDEEWRASYGSPLWKEEANLRVETADDKMFTNWGIDFLVNEYVNFSTVNTTKDLCDYVFPQLFQQVGFNGRDVVVGFTKQPSLNDAGCAAGDKVLVKYQSSSSDWKVTRHEFSHLYGNDHASGPNHPDDIMENLYSFPNTWCAVAPSNHWQQITVNANRYD